VVKLNPRESRHQTLVGVVGTAALENMASDGLVKSAWLWLRNENFGVVSGLADGIDTEAHMWLFRNG